jgi:glycosyltransferase involved in cell wall biosynthesis
VLDEVNEPAAAPEGAEQVEAGQPAVTTSPLRIAMLAPMGIPIPPALYGGAGRIVAELTDELVRRGHDVTLFGPEDARTLAALIAVAPHPVTEMNLEELFRNPVLMGSRFDAAAGHYWTKQLVELEKLAHEFDVVHAHHYAHWLVAPQLELQMVATLHNTLTHAQARGMLERFRGLPLVSISDDQRAPVADLDLNWAGTVHNGLDLKSRYQLGTGQGDYLVFLGACHRTRTR